MSVQIIDLNENQLRIIDFNDFRSLKKLVVFSASKNGLQKILPFSNDILNGMDNLKSLYLDNNQLTNLEQNTFEELISLENLILSSNHLTTIERHTFGGLKSLKNLHLNSNQLRTIELHAFDDLENLEVLNLKNNELASLDMDICLNLKNLKKFLISKKVQYFYK